MSKREYDNVGDDPTFLTLVVTLVIVAIGVAAFIGWLIDHA